MKSEKIKGILKNRKVKIIGGAVVGVLVLTLAATKILNNSSLERKNIILESNDKKDIKEESNEIKEQLEKLENIAANLSDEEKEEAENNIVDIENNNDSVEIEEVNPNSSTANLNSSSTTMTDSSTSTNKGSSSNNKQLNGSSSNLNSSNNTGSSNSGSTGGNTTNKEESHTHNWIAINSTVHHDEEGHYENILVKEAWIEEIPVYEEREVMICNDCGIELSASNAYDHIENHLLNGGKGSWREEWKQVKVGTNKINHEAVYENKWVVDKVAWDEKVTTGYKCNSCGATK